MVGTSKAAGKLTYIIMHNAGLYTPQDSPEPMYILARDWTRGNL